ncbi:hypothetical protein RUM44_007305 [Polyplax serrata]|uniref:Uncharacterized protein n=1 Tax=Polyplax serrata TaxID=468196 RepID=A0ABR1B0S6_POLSC
MKEPELQMHRLRLCCDEEEEAEGLRLDKALCPFGKLKRLQVNPSAGYQQGLVISFNLLGSTEPNSPVTSVTVFLSPNDSIEQRNTRGRGGKAGGVGGACPLRFRVEKYPQVLRAEE